MEPRKWRVQKRHEQNQHPAKPLKSAHFRTTFLTTFLTVAFGCLIACAKVLAFTTIVVIAPAAGSTSLTNLTANSGEQSNNAIATARRIGYGVGGAGGVTEIAAALVTSAAEAA